LRGFDSRYPLHFSEARAVGVNSNGASFSLA
jgi:hypothetical protein